MSYCACPVSKALREKASNNSDPGVFLVDTTGSPKKLKKKAKIIFGFNSFGVKLYRHNIILLQMKF
jgi:hypothetical protein